jgi:hypothetical protein
MLSSCPAKAGHPVITERAVFTGSPAFAGDDEGESYNPNIAFAMMFFWISFEPP